MILEELLAARKRAKQDMAKATDPFVIAGKQLNPASSMARGFWRGTVCADVRALHAPLGHCSAKRPPAGAQGVRQLSVRGGGEATTSKSDFTACA